MQRTANPRTAVRFRFRPPASEQNPDLRDRLDGRGLWQSRFKRSALPDGAKTSSGGSFPRGDWREPSDATATVWLEELEAGVPDAE